MSGTSDQSEQDTSGRSFSHDSGDRYGISRARALLYTPSSEKSSSLIAGIDYSSSMIDSETRTSIAVENQRSSYTGFDEISSFSSSTMLKAFFFASSDALYAFRSDILPSESSTQPIEFALKAAARVLQLSATVFTDATIKCNELIRNTDLDDEESKEQTISRLQDVLEPFGSVLGWVFSSILKGQRSQPVGMSFLIKDLLPRLGNVAQSARLATISDILTDAKPSTRYAAVEALDTLGSTDAKRMLAEHYPQETNRLVREAMYASLSAG